MKNITVVDVNLKVNLSLIDEFARLVDYLLSTLTFVITFEKTIRKLMKKLIISSAVLLSLASCSIFNGAQSSTMSQAATLLSSLSPNSTLGQISSLFTMLDKNGDSLVSKSESIGSVTENFTQLDKDKDSNLNLNELQGLLGLLK